MLVYYLVLVGMFLVGILLYAIGVMQIILTISCAIPMTKRMSYIYDIDIKGANKQSALTIIIWSVITAIVVFSVIYFGSFNVKAGFFAGIGVAFLFSTREFGMNNANIGDYFNTYSKFYPEKALEEIFGIK